MKSHTILRSLSDDGGSPSVTAARPRQVCTVNARTGQSARRDTHHRPLKPAIPYTEAYCVNRMDKFTNTPTDKVNITTSELAGSPEYVHHCKV